MCVWERGRERERENTHLQYVVNSHYWIIFHLVSWYISSSWSFWKGRQQGKSLCVCTHTHAHTERIFSLKRIFSSEDVPLISCCQNTDMVVVLIPQITILYCCLDAQWLWQSVDYRCSLTLCFSVGLLVCALQWSYKNNNALIAVISGDSLVGYNMYDAACVCCNCWWSGGLDIHQECRRPQFKSQLSHTGDFKKRYSVAVLWDALKYGVSASSD